MTERADFLVNNRSPRYLHGFQKDTNETTELPHTVPVGSQVTYTDSFTNYGVDTIYGKEYVIAAGSSPTVHNALSGRSDIDAHPATSISNTPAGNIAATTVQAAINELDSEKAQLAATLTNQRVPFANASGHLTDNANFYYTSGTGLRVSDSTASVSTATGAVVVNGGVGIGGRLTAGRIHIGEGSGSGALLLLGGNAAPSDGAAILALNGGSTVIAFGNRSSLLGGAYDARPLIFGASRISINTDLTIEAATASTSTTSGSIVAGGGIGCGDFFTGKYRSSDGTAGLTATRTFYAASSSGGAVNVLNTVTIKDGIITAWTQA